MFYNYPFNPNVPPPGYGYGYPQHPSPQPHYVYPPPAYCAYPPRYPRPWVGYLLAALSVKFVVGFLIFFFWEEVSWCVERFNEMRTSLSPEEQALVGFSVLLVCAFLIGVVIRLALLRIHSFYHHDPYRHGEHYRGHPYEQS